MLECDGARDRIALPGTALDLSGFDQLREESADAMAGLFVGPTAFDDLGRFHTERMTWAAEKPKDTVGTHGVIRGQVGRALSGRLGLERERGADRRNSVLGFYV